MNYKLLFVFLFCVSCATEISNNKKKIIFDKSFSNIGFTLVYNDDLKKTKKISRKIDNRSLIIFQKNLKKGTSVKITNLINEKSIIATVGLSAKYPNFYNSVISERISKELNINENEPYVMIQSINNTSAFLAKKAKTFEEEKKVANKAPVEGIKIDNISLEKNVDDEIENTNTEFSYIIKIADFYFEKTAHSLKKRIENELKIKNIKIKTISKTNYRLFIGPFKNLDSLKKAYNDINQLDFENFEILKI